jgi:hypothetical protein
MEPTNDLLMTRQPISHPMPRLPVVTSSFTTKAIIILYSPIEQVANARKDLEYESSDTPCDPPDSPAMANRTIYTRVHSKRSAGRLVSGKGPKGDLLSDTALLEEFRNHAKFRNHTNKEENEGKRELTALVSGSDRIVDSVRRAFDKHCGDGESSAFIEVPPTTNENATRIHSAKELAEKCGLPDPNKFSHEVVFEWAIPEKYVVYEVSLQTLMERGLQECYF